MSDQAHPLLNEYFHAAVVSPAQMDRLWEQGWRHFGDYFFRYNQTVMEGQHQHIVALRTDLHHATFSKSQRRTWRRNGDLEVRLRPAQIDAEKEALFDLHKERFEENKPSTIHTFLGDQPSAVPCPCLEVAVYRPSDNRLVAASFLDVGQTAVSSIYAFFDPAESQRRLGIYTMLLEMVWAKRQGKRWYYSGYTTVASSRYDYKKQFNALQYNDFSGRWRPWEL
ncbi:MAG: arginine-tRNA-protein transferase [Chloroflexi bacterium]|nr:arginine-tRNA-protein transferase [Chloroflexota bacterium]